MLKVFSFITISLMLLGFTTRAHACACCGIDDTWSKQEFSSQDYQYKQLLELQFTADYFSDAGYEQLYEIMEVSFDQEKLKLVGTVFKADLLLENKGTHSRQDISFVVRPESQLTDEAVIFHEVLIEGQITLQIAGSPETNYPAKLIMQGVGNACLIEDSLTKWMIKIEGHDLAGSGKLTYGDPAAHEQETKE